VLPAAGGRCATTQLKIAASAWYGATGNELATFTVTNTSGTSCYLGGYPGVALLDSGGKDLQDAQRSTDSFFGTYQGPHRVDIKPGTATTFDLTYGGIDPCGNNGPAQHPAALKVTPPDDYDSTTIPAKAGGATMVVCPNTLVVHPVGSTLRQG
jgi:predicted small lipoprotein YifL